MSDKRMFIVPGELMERIDAHRGEMSRAEFVYHCIENLLGKRTQRQTYAGTPEELRTSISAGSRDVPTFQARTIRDRHLTSNERQATAVKAIQPQGGMPEEKGDTKYFSWLWVPALVLFGFGDTLTSHLVFAAGGSEANPLLGSLMRSFGGGMMSFVLVKTVLIVALLLLSTFGLKKHTSVVPAVLTGLGAYLVVHNLLSLWGLMGKDALLSGLGVMLGGAI